VPKRQYTIKLVRGAKKPPEQNHSVEGLKFRGGRQGCAKGSKLVNTYQHRPIF